MQLSTGEKIGIALGSIAVVGLVIYFIVSSAQAAAQAAATAAATAAALPLQPATPTLPSDGSINANDEATFQKMLSAFANSSFSSALPTIQAQLPQYIQGGNLEDTGNTLSTIIMNGKRVTPLSGAFLLTVSIWAKTQNSASANQLVSQLETIFHNNIQITN